MTGVLVIDKPRGPTSHDIVDALRKGLKTKKVGHTGTLDPMATGVLPICLGEATKVVQLLTAEDKAYEATVTFGTETDTLDAQGKVTATAPVPATLDLERALAGLRGTYQQLPPMFSAVKVGGKKLYESARAGEEVEREAREVTVRRLEVVEATPVSVKLVVESSKGFFVRVLAQDLGRALGTVAHLSALRRTRSGAFTLAQAVSVEDAIAGKGLISLEAALAHLPSLRVTLAQVKKVLSGGVVEAAAVEGPVCVLGPTGALLAIADVVDGVLKYRRVMAATA